MLAISDGMIAYYPFDGDTSDASGRGYDATAYNNYSYVLGVNNQAIRLVGKDHVGLKGGYVRVPTPSFDMMDAFTVSLWVRYEGHTSRHGENLIGFGRAVRENTIVQIDYSFDARRIGFTVGRWGAPVGSIGSAWPDDFQQNWTHLTLRADRGVLTGFVNGRSIGSTTYTLPKGRMENVGGIGAHWFNSGGTSSNRFIGAVDEVRIYDRALSSQEIAALADDSDRSPAPTRDAVFESLAKWTSYLDCPEKVVACSAENPQDRWKPGDDVTINGVATSYRVERVFRDDRTGFFALGLDSPVEGPALVIRGTNERSDWWSNLGTVGIGYSQFDSAKDDVRKWIDGRPIDLIGHSLGGANAQWFAAWLTSNGQRIDEVVTFNSPGIAGNSIPELDATDFVSANAGRVRHYIANGDVVSLAGRAFIRGEVRMATFTGSRLLERHVVPLVASHTKRQTKNGTESRFRPVNIEWRSLSTDELSAPTFAFDNPEYLAELVVIQSVLWRRCLTRTFLACPLAPLVPLLRNRAGTESLRATSAQVSRILAPVAEIVDNTQQDFTNAVRLTLFDRRQILYLGRVLTGGVDGDPPAAQAMQVEGTMQLRLDYPLSLVVPQWAGGYEESGVLLAPIPGGSPSGRMTAEEFAVKDRFQLFGSLGTLDGTATVTTRTGNVTVEGVVSVANGLLTAPIRAKVDSLGNLVATGRGRIAVPAGVPSVGGVVADDVRFLINFTANETSSDDYVEVWIPSSLGQEASFSLRLAFDGTVNVSAGHTLSPQTSSEGESDATQSSSYLISGDVARGVFVVETGGSALGTVQVHSPTGNTITVSSDMSDSGVQTIPELISPSRTAFVVRNPSPGLWTIRSESPQGEQVRFAAYRDDVAPEIETISAAGGAKGGPVRITLNAKDADSTASIALFYDDNASGYDGILVADKLVESDGQLTYDWQPESMASGEYFIYARVTDGSNEPAYAYSETVVRVEQFVPPPAITTLAESDDRFPELPATRNPEPTIRGTAMPGTKVQIFVDEDAMGEVEPDAEGKWSFSFAGQPLAIGSRELLALTTSPHGDASGSSESFSVAVVGWTNPSQPFDVTGDGIRSPKDAFALITFLSSRTDHILPTPVPPTAWGDPFYDVNADGMATPLDALLVIESLNRQGAAEAEGSVPVTPIQTFGGSVLPADSFAVVTNNERTFVLPNARSKQAVRSELPAPKRHVSVPMPTQRPAHPVSRTPLGSAQRREEMSIWNDEQDWWRTDESADLESLLSVLAP